MSLFTQKASGAIRLATLCCVLLVAIPCAEARPRDPFSGFVASITRAFQPQKVVKRKYVAKKRYIAKQTVKKQTVVAIKAKSQKVAKAVTKKRPTKVAAIQFKGRIEPEPKPIPSITVHPLPKDGALMPGAIDKFTPSLSELYQNFPVKRPPGWSQTGIASWYGPGFHGRRTACGQLYNEYGMTAAHRSLKCGTQVQVYSGSKSVDVTINDRGPFINGRIIDLSRGAAQDLGIIKKGTASVKLFVIGKD